MATVSKQLLSGSPASGRPIQITQVASTGDTIHVAVAGSTDFDEVWLWAVNRDASIRKLTVEFGGVVTGDLITVSLDPDVPTLVVAGQPLNGGLTISAFAALTNVCSVWGFVNRISA
jgi:hypothetical protein